MKFVVTGGAGFIGSHLADRLISDGHDVCVVDNLISGFECQVNSAATLAKVDITDYPAFRRCIDKEQPDGIFHMAAIARTPWCIDNPLLAAQVNANGTLNVLEVAAQLGVKRSILSSSNVVYAAYTPYRATKEMGEMWGRVYSELYGVSNLSLRYSNVYGKRQSELGPSPNVFAAFRKSKHDNGYINVTGNGEQTRQFTHVSDIADGLVKAMASDYIGAAIDLVSPQRYSMNHVVSVLFDSEIKYLPERFGDVKHIIQDPARAKEILGWEAKVALEDGIADVLECEPYLRGQ